MSSPLVSDTDKETNGGTRCFGNYVETFLNGCSLTLLMVQEEEEVNGSSSAAPDKEDQT